MPHYETERSPYRVQVLDRALLVLQELSENGPDLTLAEVSQALRLPKSTVHRLLMVLERHKLIEKNSSTGKYRLGLKLFELGTRAVTQLNLRDRARPFLERLVRETSETVHLCVYDAGEVVYVDKVEPERSVRLSSSIGRRNPAYSTAVGKAILAYLPEARVEAAVEKHGLRPITSKTITTMLELKAELAKVRQRGYAVDNEESEPGCSCVGAAVRGFGPEPVAAISVSAPAFRLTKRKIPEVAKSVMRAAQELSAELGYKPAGIETAAVSAS